MGSPVVYIEETVTTEIPISDITTFPFDHPDAVQTLGRAMIQSISRAHNAWYLRFSDFDYLTTIQTAVISLGEVQSYLASTKAIPGGYNVGVLNMAFSNNVITLIRLFGPGGTFGEIFSPGQFVEHLFGSRFGWLSSLTELVDA